MDNNQQLQQQQTQGIAAADQIPHDIIASLVINGDLSKLSPQQKVEYYNKFCSSLGLNSLTQPFELIVLNGKERLYAKKDATEQLRRIYGVSVDKVDHNFAMDMVIVTVYGHDRSGRNDSATGAVNIKGQMGENLANCIMKAETKAKRRFTLSICGLGMLDETEVESIPSNQKQQTQPDPHAGSINIDVLDPSNQEHVKLWNRMAALFADPLMPTHLYDGQFDVQANYRDLWDKFQSGTLGIDYADKMAQYLQTELKTIKLQSEDQEQNSEL